jgi:hypothetical protein
LLPATPAYLKRLSDPPKTMALVASSFKLMLEKYTALISFVYVPSKVTIKSFLNFLSIAKPVFNTCGY